MKKLNTLEEWFEKLFKGFREELQKLSDEHQSYILICEDLRPPCQVEALWVIDPQGNDFQFVLFTHDSELNDLKIRIHGPCNVSSNIDAKLIDSFFNQERFQKYNYTNSNQTYTQALEELYFSNFDERGFPSKETPGRATASFGNDCVWMCRGKFQCLNHDEIVKVMIENIKFEFRDYPIRVNVFKFMDKIIKSSTLVYGLGGIITPFVWIGDLPTPTPKQRHSRAPLNDFIKPVLRDNYFGRELYVTNDGYLILECGKIELYDGEMDHNEIQNTQSLINCIFGTFLAYGIRIYSAENFCLNQKTLSKDKSRELSSWTNFLPKSVHEIRERPFLRAELATERQIIQLSNLKKIINKSELLVRRDNFRLLLPSFLKSYTDLEKKKDNNQSFILSWQIIEQYIGFLWKKLNNTDHKKKNSRNVPIKRQIHNLKNDEIISLERYQTLDIAREHRNKYIHEMKDVPRDIAKNNFELCKALLVKWINSEN